ncbi:MAG TPA: hypothetical protein VKU87_04585, partial [Thermomicrobiaceae bacterium]|nr:hypothetical protein [Thermomicrobiaceae bacterium]
MQVRMPRLIELQWLHGRPNRPSIKRLVALAVLLIALFGLVTTRPVLGATDIVTSYADSGTGSLRDTIAAAQAGDTITFAPNLDGQTINLASALTVDKNLTIQGP